MKNQIETISGWGWMFDDATLGDIVDSLQEMESPEEYNQAIERSAKEECGFVVEGDQRPSDVVIETFKPFANELEEYCIEEGDLPGWVLAAIK